MDDRAQLLAVFVGVVSVLVLLYRKTHPLYAIPTIGPSAPLLSYIGAVRFIFNAQEMLREGYTKYKGSAFKIPLLDQWIVVINGPELVEELRRYPDEEVSFTDAVTELLQSKWTLGLEVHKDPYHITLVREKLTRSLTVLLPEVLDELDLAIKEFIPVQGDEWLSVPVLTSMQRIVARATNRIFVGLPKCRDDDYLDLVINFTSAVIKGRTLINLFPTWMKPFVGSLISSTKRSADRATKHLQPIIDAREADFHKLGDSWDEKPNDMMMWLMDEARDKPDMLEAVVKRILVINFAAIHSSSSSVTHALYHLAENPSILYEIRQEVDPVIKEEGWTKASLAKLWKLDSFMKESQRFNGLNGMALTRMAMVDLTLSDGTRIPRGTILAAGATTMHHDGTIYTDPETFDPFRFYRLREEGGGMKHQFVSTRADYIPFGHGKHACPGRFYAEHELKAMLAYIIMNYDLKFENDAPRPKNQWIGSTIIPEPNAHILFRKRQK
ncbi:cytochrome P450 [Obba rivulosa]|uniref:Cytochrome P450 n=1 Tax=Obba rivulosa TaxID=1052685 RepID=A0A8E2J6F5_9APHY|nr:cytochrome P450 [Obba rivulosa]